MTIATRLIGTILFTRGGRQVKGKSFASDRTVGMAIQAAKVWAERGLDEIVLLDVTAGKEGRGPDLPTVEAIASELFIPLAVGGGIRSMEDADALFRAGADKVVIGRWRSGIRPLADRYGSQAVVAAVDVSQDWACADWYKGWCCADGNAPGYAELAQGDGAGEILLQSIDRDGTRTGYDVDLIRRVAQVAKVPLIASGGCGAVGKGCCALLIAEDMQRAIDAGADAVAAGAVWCFDDVTPSEVKAELRQKGVVVR